jgi:hypothetical protein
MKKITFILFALIAGTTFAQTADALAGADIVSPLTINQAADFNFGKVSNVAGGTVIIKTDNTLDALSTAVFIGSNTLSAAAFTVTATDTYAYTVNLGGDITLTNQAGAGAETMIVSALSHDSTEEGVPAGTETFGVSGTLTVGIGQVPGYYEGTMTVGVSYN